MLSNWRCTCPDRAMGRIARQPMVWRRRSVWIGSVSSRAPPDTLWTSRSRFGWTGGGAAPIGVTTRPGIGNFTLGHLIVVLSDSPIHTAEDLLLPSPTALGRRSTSRAGALCPG